MVPHNRWQRGKEEKLRKIPAGRREQGEEGHNVPSGGGAIKEQAQKGLVKEVVHRG